MDTKILTHFTEKITKKLDLVTREEFEVQSKVLQRTRLQLIELEKKISELENLQSQNKN